MRYFLFILLGLLFTAPLSLNAQGPDDDPPRYPDDHFWRRRVKIRLNLQEKINRPIQPFNVAGNTVDRKLFPQGGEGNNGPSQHKFTRGVVNALLRLYKNEKVQGYVPDSLHVPQTYSEMKKEIKVDQGSGGGGTGGGSGSEGDDGGGGFGGGFGGDDGGFGGGFGEDDGGFGDFGGDDFGGFGGGDESGDGGGDTMDTTTTTSSNGSPSFYDDFYKHLDIIEDRVFDKNKSSMYYDLKYFVLNYTPPTGKEEAAVAFKWNDIRSHLEGVQVNNFYNNAESRNAREIFELRRFQAWITNLFASGEERTDVSKTLQQAEKRRLQMIEFEHNLWEF